MSSWEIPFARWYAAIGHRRSRRRFDPRPIEPNLLANLQDICAKFRPYPEARAVVVTQSPDEVFKGAIGHYGKIKDAPAFIAFIGRMDSPYVQERVGYLGEGIILESTALNLATCWVAGLFRPEVAGRFAGANEGERVLAVTPVGHPQEEWSLEEKIMSGFGRNHRRKPLAKLVTGPEESKWPAWIKQALDAARLAPSAVNRQPWRFHVEPEQITISVDSLKETFHISKRLDCGIAMLHLETAALNDGVKGLWEFLEAPKVAGFRVTR
jgi:nitroreductase